MSGVHASTNETNVLIGVPTELKLSTGMIVNIRPLKTIELFKLLKIISSSGAVAMRQFRLNKSMSTEEFLAHLTALVMFAVPQAEQETLDFLRAMVEPSALISPERTKSDREKNQILWAELHLCLINPEPDDTLSIIQEVVNNEAGNIQSLGKRIAQMMKMAFPSLNKMDVEMKNSSESTQTESSEDSPQPSDSSLQSTDGQTS